MPKVATEERPKRVAKSHIYRVEINGEVKMVQTTSRAKAIRHFTKEVKATIPTQRELVELVKEGVVVEEQEV